MYTHIELFKHLIVSAVFAWLTLHVAVPDSPTENLAQRARVLPPKEGFCVEEDQEK
jgi:hypothetical protein